MYLLASKNNLKYKLIFNIMEISNYTISEINERKKRIAEFNKNKKEIQKELKNLKVKTSLLNVDSNYRNINPKNICESNSIVLPNNPIRTKKGSSEIKINYPNHSLAVGDIVTVNNVSSYDKTLSNSLFLVNNIKYLIIYVPNHGVPSDYKEYVDDVSIDINIISKLNNQFYGSIPINMLIGNKTITTYSEISQEFTIVQSNYFENLKVRLKEKFTNITTDDDIAENFIFVGLDFIFQNSNSSLFEINDVFQIKFNSLNGIPLRLINADYPINYDKSKGSQEIISVEQDYIYINCDNKAYSDGNLGGEKISIFKVLKTLPGYPNAGEFTFQLRKDFTNVVRLELVSSEFPFTQFIITDKVNNKLYWQHLDDGDVIYSISIPSGNYSASNLITTISNKMNEVERYNSTPESRILNKFEITLNTFTNKIEFRAFAETLLPNSITESKITIQNKEYYRLDIKHKNNFVSVGDTITISNSESIGAIPKAAVNSSHKVYSINKEDSTYSILLVPFNEINSTSNEKGGASIKIKTVAKVRFLFNFKDTLGDILNFKNAGDEYSITGFNSVVTNTEDYIYPNNLDSVGNTTSTNNFLQLAGKQTYWLLYINNLESVILNNGVPNSFAKILLPGIQGEIVFNSYVNNPVEPELPIPTLSELNVRVTDPHGNVVDFENTNFSFTLRIFQLISIPVDTGKNSQDTSYDKELIDKISKTSLDINV